MICLISLFFGLIIGSAINAFIYRFASYKEREIFSLLDSDTLATNDTFYSAQPRSNRSYCDFCGQTLPWYTLIPVLSYILFKSKTHCCHEKLPVKYPLIEAFCALWGFFCAQATITFSHLALLSLWGYGLIALALCDYEYQIVSDNHLDLLLLLAFCHNLLNNLPITSHLSGYIIFYSLFKIIALSYHALRGYEGLGEGDIKVAGILGLYHGMEAIGSLILISSCSALMVGLALAAPKKKHKELTLPFLPFLHAASLSLIVYNFMSEKGYLLCIG